MNAASRKVLSSGIIFYPPFEGKSKEEDRRAHTGTEDWGLHAPSPVVGIGVSETLQGSNDQEEDEWRLDRHCSNLGRK